MAWVIGASLTILGAGLLGYGWFLSRMPYVDANPALAIIPGAIFSLVGIITLIAKAVH